MMNDSDETTVNETSVTSNFSSHVPPLILFRGIHPMPGVYFDQTPFIINTLMDKSNMTQSVWLPMSSSISSSLTVNMPPTATNATMKPVLGEVTALNASSLSNLTISTASPANATSSMTSIQTQSTTTVLPDTENLKTTTTEASLLTIESDKNITEMKSLFMKALLTSVSNIKKNDSSSVNSNVKKRNPFIQHFLEASASEDIMNLTSKECQEQLERTDSCIRTVLLFDESKKNNFSFPRTFDELDTVYCKNLNETLKCLGGYAKCLSRIPRIIYNLVYLHIKKTLQHDICRQELFRENILFHGRCFKSKQDMQMIRRILDQGTVTSLYVLKNVATTRIIPWGCCAFMTVFEDGKKSVDDFCKDRTGNETGDFFMNFMKSAATDLLEIGCRKYSSTQVCNQNLPEAMTVFQELLSGDIPHQKYSPIIPLVEIARRLADHFET